MLDALRVIAEEIRNLLGSAAALARLRRKHSTCRFYPHVMVSEDSSLGRYNVLFRDVSVLSSTIGDHTFIQKGTIATNAELGKFCSIAMNVNIGLTQHAVTFVSTHPAFYLLNTPLRKTFSQKDMFETSRRTIVGNDVWIGQNSLVMGGVTIGTGAIIAAGSVVTRDIEPYAIAGGVPARTMKYRFDPEIIQALLGSRWWEAPDEELEKIHHLSADPLAFLKALRNRHE